MFFLVFTSLFCVSIACVVGSRAPDLAELLDARVHRSPVVDRRFRITCYNARGFGRNGPGRPAMVGSASSLLRVIADQVSVIEDDISGLYENLFIETCADWAVPYIGGLVGYTPVASSPLKVTSAVASAESPLRCATRACPKRQCATMARAPAGAARASAAA